MVGTGAASPQSQGIIDQARQGSIAAIIQLLNESLAHLNVRTRAVLHDRVLQLLCEAETTDALDATLLVPHIQQILEAISPPNFCRVKLYSRIVREQQLLWLEEIMRDADNQVIWSEEIQLKRSNVLKRLKDNWEARQSQRRSPELAKDFNPALADKKMSRSTQVLAVLGLGFAVIGAGVWMLRDQVLGLIDPQVISPNLMPDVSVTDPSPQNQSEAAEPLEPAVESTLPNATQPLTATTIPGEEANTEADAFVEAVRLAEKAAVDGKVAASRREWLDLAYRWQQASDLMETIEPEDPRYVTAQDRVQVYQQNSEAALQEATQLE